MVQMLKRPVRIQRLGKAVRGYRVFADRQRHSEAKRGRLFDAWIPDLAPRAALMDRYQSGVLRWEEFSETYKMHLQSTDCQDLLKPLALLSLRRPVVLLCNCADERRCPERTLAEALLECRRRGDFRLSPFRQDAEAEVEACRR